MVKGEVNQCPVQNWRGWWQSCRYKFFFISHSIAIIQFLFFCYIDRYILASLRYGQPGNDHPHHYSVIKIKLARLFNFELSSNWCSNIVYRPLSYRSTTSPEYTPDIRYGQMHIIKQICITIAIQLTCKYNLIGQVSVASGTRWDTHWSGLNLHERGSSTCACGQAIYFSDFSH